jgi:hypothetical protein
MRGISAASLFLALFPALSPSGAARQADRWDEKVSLARYREILEFQVSGYDAQVWGG